MSDEVRQRMSEMEIREINFLLSGGRAVIDAIQSYEGDYATSESLKAHSNTDGRTLREGIKALESYFEEEYHRFNPDEHGLHGQVVWDVGKMRSEPGLDELYCYLESQGSLF
jgi:hypothetical protein